MTTDNRVVYLTNARLSFPNIAMPQTLPGRKQGDPERKVYNAVFLLDANDPQFATFMARVTDLATETWKEHAQAVLQMIYADRKLRCFSRGEENINQKTLIVRDGYEGKMVISAGGDRQPQAIDGAGHQVDPTNTMQVMATHRKLYGGCRVNVALRPWAQQNTHGRAIRCDIVAIQFAKDDVPFGEAAPDVSGLFGVVDQPQQGFGAPVAPGATMPPPPFAGLPPLPGAPAAPAFGAPAPGGLPQMPPFPGAH